MGYVFVDCRNHCSMRKWLAHNIRFTNQQRNIIRRYLFGFSRQRSLSCPIFLCVRSMFLFRRAAIIHDRLLDCKEL